MNVQGRIGWITKTGLLMALLIVLQAGTAGTASFAGQYITGTCVNGVLAVSVLTAGIWSGAAVAALSPLIAFLLGVGPQMIPLVPMIALGNLTYVTVLYFLAKGPSVPGAVGGLLAAAAGKFAVLYVGVGHILIPALASKIQSAQAGKLTAMFSWPQLVTALLGGGVALLILPLLKRALKR